MMRMIIGKENREYEKFKSQKMRRVWFTYLELDGIEFSFYTIKVLLRTISHVTKVMIPVNRAH